MEMLAVEGGKRLEGEVDISGAKNSSLPILISSLLTDEQLVLHNLPHLYDVTSMITLLRELNVDITMHENLKLTAQANNINNWTAPYDIVRTMRASIMVIAPLLTRFHKAIVSLPGGCLIGSRPIDMHLQGLQSMGAICEIKEGYIHCSAPKGLKGATVNFDTKTVTGTENILMAATLAKGTTIIKNAACEPEIVDLANCLNHMGAKIKGHGQNTIKVEGVKKLHGAEYTVMPDRIESGTFLAAAVATKGHIKINGTNYKYLEEVLEKFNQTGATISYKDDWIELDMKKKRPKAVNIITAPYPMFPTDMQAQFIAVNAVADGNSTVEETIFENRFMHVDEIKRMGADISIMHNSAIINGVDSLSGADVIASDLRASASLIISALAAEGKSNINRIYHIDRGYECIEEKMQKLGANIVRKSS